MGSFVAQYSPDNSMLDLINQINGLFNDAIDREISRRHRNEKVASVLGNGDMTSLRPITAKPSIEVQPVANVGDGKTN